MSVQIRTSMFLSIVCMLSLNVATHIYADVLDQDNVALVDSVGNNKICFHLNTTCVDSLKPLIINRIKLAVSEIDKIIEFKDVEFRIIVFPERTLRDKGMSGVAPDNKHIYILLNPDHPRLSRSLSEELVAVIAHEYHHTLRHRTVGFGSNLLGAIISEGLADHFCMEVTGKYPPWANQIPDEELALWWSKAEKEWLNPEYDYHKWFVGYGKDIPHGVGYSIGRRIIADYLAEHLDERPSQLYATPATEFLPAEQK